MHCRPIALAQETYRYQCGKWFVAAMLRYSAFLIRVVFVQEDNCKGRLYEGIYLKYGADQKPFVLAQRLIFLVQVVNH